MLVIISDLHLNDGTTGAKLAPGAVSLFMQRLRESALSASWRADGAYRPVERIDLVLLGDTFDLLRSARWRAAPAIRPWGNLHSPELLGQIAAIANGIVAENQQALAMFRALGREAVVTVPPMLRLAHPARRSDQQPVPVRMHYMVGNHDWFYHVAGADYDALRQTLVERLGLANRPDRPFPHDITESDELLQAMRRHKVTARHGDLYDPLSFDGDRDASSLGDAMVIELIGRFAAEVQAALGDSLPVATLVELRELDHFRPLLLVPVWLDGLLERTCPALAMRKRVRTLWDRLADEFLAGDFVRQRDHWIAPDLVDGLARALKYSKRMSSGWGSATVQWLQKIRGADTPSYYPHALTEADFRNRRAKHVVYGHTHAGECVPLDASYAEGCVLDQTYFNAGTWRRVHNQTRCTPGGHEFIASDAMSYLAFFQGDERGGRPYETWSGMLGHPPLEMIVHRIDPGRANQVAGHATAPSAAALGAPHFATLPGQATGLPARRR
jgi:UDP-2,3-diacylglucosamine pyrophosphatase LpxH